MPASSTSAVNSKRPRVVVDAIAVVVPRHAEGGVLQHAGLVGHVPKMLEIDLGQRRAGPSERVGLKDRPQPGGVLDARAFEALDVATSHGRPEHGAAVGGGTRTERQALRVVAQQVDDLAGDRRRIAPGHQNAASVGEELARIAVGRRHDRLARSDRVGKRSRGDLLGFQIRGDVDVGGARGTR